MAKKTFESALARLEEITKELENGDLSLEISLKKFNEGSQLAGYCSEQLSQAQKKVELLVAKDGAYETIPFEAKDLGNKDLPE